MPLENEQLHLLKKTVEGYLDLGLVDEAARVLDQLPLEFQRGRRVVCLRIAVLEAQEKFLEASYLAEDLSLREPDNIEHMLLVARCRFQAGRAVDALWWLQANQTRYHESPEYHYFRAACHAAVGDPEAAETALQEAQELEAIPRWERNVPPEEEPNEFFFGSPASATY